MAIQAGVIHAQPSDPASEVKPGEEIFQVLAPMSKIKMINLDSRVIETPNRIKVVDGFNPDILTVSALSPNRIRLRAEQPGVTSIKLIDEFDTVFVVEAFVEPDTRELKAYLERLFPGSAIEVVGLRDGVVLRGWVTEPTHIPQILEVADQFYESVQNQLNVGGVSQVQLHVKVIEVQRTKLREMGFNMLLAGQQYLVANTVGSLAPLTGVTAPFGGPPSATIGASGFGNSELQFAITGNSDIFQGFLKMLQSEALAKILAEPVLVTTSGRPAAMLSGGEFPILVPQNLGATAIEWREFGVRLEAVPVVLGNGRLRLDIAPEVSDRDFSNAVNVDGFVVPGVTVRRVNTQVEMRFGETLMIGGLISTRKTGTTNKVPFLGELPWIGAAFSRKDFTVGETELMILVTPQMAAPMMPHQAVQQGPGMMTDVPVDKELYFGGLLEVPLFGPDCPDCQPNDQMYIPQGTHMQAPMYSEEPAYSPQVPQQQGVPQYTPSPNSPTSQPGLPHQPSNAPANGPTMIQQTSAEVPAGTNPFRVSVNRDLDAARAGSSGGVQHASAETIVQERATAPTNSRLSSRRTQRVPLSGLISPSRTNGSARPQSSAQAPPPSSIAQ